jgi:cytochrome P450
MTDSSRTLLYPPTVLPPDAPLGFFPYVVNFIRNPLSVMPRAVYHDPIVQHGNRCWVTDPSLIKTMLLDERERFPKTDLERRVFGGLLGNGILIAKDPEWRWQRQTAAPIFRHADILNYVPTMARVAEAQVAHWLAARPGSLQPVDHDMTRATFQVIAETMLNAGNAAASRFGLEETNKAYMRPLAWPLLYGVLGLPANLPFPGKPARLRAESRMRADVLKIIRSRRAVSGACSDLLSRLLEAKSPETGETMTDEQVADNLLTFLLAGHETTARALAWSLYLLSQSPSWEERLLSEVIETAGSQPIMSEHVDRLAGVSRFIKESMRLFPPISSISRIVGTDIELGGKRLKSGSLIIIPIFALHRHRALWSDPDGFDPDRFDAQNDDKSLRYRYMPFGAGPRICIGASFSMVEAVVMLATFLRAARFVLPKGRRHIPVSGISLRAKPAISLHVWPHGTRH